MVGTAVHFGGGNIGRGFIAELFHETGYRIVFVDVIDKLIDDLNALPSAPAPGAKPPTVREEAAADRIRDAAET